MKPCILFRKSLAEEAEFQAASAHFEVFTSRMDIPKDRLVIGRYSVLPYYDELEQDLTRIGSRLVNSYEQHRYIADITRWADTLGSLTPQTWTEWGSLPEGSYVLKGRTNSRKHQWNTRMFAPTKADVPRIAQRLWDDALIADQGLVVRKYIPLKKLDEGLNGMPVTNEWRTFWVMTSEGTPLCFAQGYYWASHPECAEKASLPESVIREVGERAARVIGQHASFFVLDLAETETGEWIVIEANDGQMSGLSLINPNEFYAGLKEAIFRHTLVHLQDSDFPKCTWYDGKYWRVGEMVRQHSLVTCPDCL